MYMRLQHVENTLITARKVKIKTNLVATLCDAMQMGKAFEELSVASCISPKSGHRVLQSYNCFFAVCMYKNKFTSDKITAHVVHDLLVPIHDRSSTDTGLSLAALHRQ